MRTYPVLPGQEAFSLRGTPSVSQPKRAGLVMALIHGFTGNPYSMRPLAEQLAARGFPVEVPRLPGHGTDVQDMRRTRYADWRAEVLRTLDKVKEQSERVMLVGLSMGGTLVLDVASSGERPVTAVAAINAHVLDREGFLVKLAPVLERIMPVAPAVLAGMHADDIAKPGVSERAYGWVPTAAGNSLLRELPRIRRQIPGLSCPALIAYSPQDHNVPPDNSRAILELLAEKQPIELVLERSYHVATMDYDLELIADRITALADSISG